MNGGAAKCEKREVEAGGEGDKSAKKTDEGKDPRKDTKTKVKEVTGNIHMPKLSKLHKPYLGEGEGSSMKSYEEDSSTLVEVRVSTFVSEKSSPKEKDVEAGDKEESKELLEKEEGDGAGDDNQEKTGVDDTKEKKGNKETKPADQIDVGAIFRKAKDTVSFAYS